MFNPMPHTPTSLNLPHLFSIFISLSFNNKSLSLISAACMSMSVGHALELGQPMRGHTPKKTESRPSNSHQWPVLHS